MDDQTGDRYVVCVDNASYPASLERNRRYKTVPDWDAEADGDARIVDESGEAYLYSQDRFAP